MCFSQGCWWWSSVFQTAFLGTRLGSHQLISVAVEALLRCFLWESLGAHEHCGEAFLIFCLFVCLRIQRLPLCQHQHAFLSVKPQTGYVVLKMAQSRLSSLSSLRWVMTELKHFKWHKWVTWRRTFGIFFHVEDWYGFSDSYESISIYIGLCLIHHLKENVVILSTRQWNMKRIVVAKFPKSRPQSLPGNQQKRLHLLLSCGSSVARQAASWYREAGFAGSVCADGQHLQLAVCAGGLEKVFSSPFFLLDGVTSSRAFVLFAFCPLVLSSRQAVTKCDSLLAPTNFNIFTEFCLETRFYKMMKRILITFWASVSF